MLTRRSALLALAGLAPLVARAGEVIDLQWPDLIPPGAAQPPAQLQNIIPHDEAGLAAQQPASAGVRTDWNGLTVRLPGYVVPLDFSGTGLTAFILVPYVGACIHVPPPPANQLVFVTTERPYDARGLFEAVYVTGMFGTATTSTQLAEIGYALSADRIEPYRW